LGGLWHGASWSFIIWGFLHGLYLGLNHGFRALCGPALGARLDRSRLFGVAAWMLTMLAVIMAWVVFRAETLQGAGRILQSMTHATHVNQVHALLWNDGLSLSIGGLWCGILSAMACLAPNSNRIGDYLLRQCQTHTGAGSLIAGASSAAVAFMLVMNVMRDSISAFIYFNF